MLDAITTLLFKYPPRVFARGDMVTAPVVPVLLIALAALIAVLAITVAYARVSTLRPVDRAVLGALRAAAVLLVIGCLLRPGLVIASAVPQRNVFAVLVDDSRSMRIGDVDGSSRAQAVQRVFADTAELTRKLGERFALRRFRFAARAEPLASVAGLTSKGTRSDLARALDDVREELSGMPLAGVVLVSDGADNGSSAYNDALLALRARRVPVYTVGVGREQFDRDLAIDRVVAPQRVLAGAAMLIEADVRTRGLGSEQAKVTVEADGRVIATENIKAPERGDVAHVRLRVPSLAAGTYRLAVRVKAMPGEIVTENNAWQASLEVRAGPDRILYIDGEPRPEFAFLRRAIANDSGVQVVGLMRSAENKFLRLGVRDSLDLLGGFPTSREELFRYRGIILGSIEASFFSADQLCMIADFVSQRGGGLLVLGGRASLSEGGFAGTPLAEVLPVTLQRGEINVDGEARPLVVRPTRVGQTHPALQLRATLRASIARWDSMPPLTTVNQIGSTRAGATVLLAGRAEGGRSDVPVLTVQRYGRGTSAVFAVQDSWLWRMDASVAVEDDSFQTFWRQLARWLVDGSPERLEISASPARVAPGEPVTLRAHVSNTFFNDVNNATVQVGVRSPAGVMSSVPLEWSLREDGSYSGTFTPPDSGRYELTAEAKFGRDSVETASATLLVDDQGADLAQAERRTPLLRRIADETGGRYYDLDGVARLADDAVFTDSGITVREAKDLWDMPAVFLTLALLLGAEWGYRRWRGLA
ncbi:MAG: glutamine amidotransferase [Gemmatimonas sp.]